MADIDFEEQLALEKEEKEKEEKRVANTRVDPDGTQYEWDEEKKAWFPKIDQNFIAQYQMNYGNQGENASTKNSSAATDSNQAAGEGQMSGEGQGSYDEYYNYYKYYQDYHKAGAQHETILNRQRQSKKETKEDTTEEALMKLEKLENSMDQLKEGEESGEGGGDEDMANYTEEQIKQYNQYWSYYYGTEYHDYYGDCMRQQAEGQGDSGKGQGEGETGQETAGQKKGKKRKGAQQPERQEGWFSMDESNNTNVYVSGLPFDITDEEFKELMSKYGMIMYDPHTKKPKVKLYRDEKGDPKGDGRCCYIKVESVDLCLKLLEGYDFKGHKVHVERATFQMKGEFDPSKKKKKLSNKEKKKLKERQAKLFDWRPERPQGSRPKWEKVVILKNVFDPALFEENPLHLNTVRDTIRAECSKYGEVKKVVVYDRNADGVVSVSFQEPEEADNCVESMHQRYLGLRRILATTWDGQTKYEVVETEAERTERLKKWEQFLEGSDKSNSAAKDKAGSSGSGTDKNPAAANGSTTPSVVDNTSADNATEPPQPAAAEKGGDDQGLVSGADGCGEQTVSSEARNSENTESSAAGIADMGSLQDTSDSRISTDSNLGEPPVTDTS